MKKIIRNEIEAFDVKKLKPYDKNAKKHPDEQVEALAKSIKEFGFQQPIVIDEKNEILLGHGRMLAAKKLELETVPVWQVKGYTEAQKKTFRIVDNKITLDTGFDVELLQFDFTSLESGGVDLAEWNLEDFKFDVTPDSNDDDKKSVTKEDNFTPKDDFKVTIKEGDEILLNDHRIICGEFKTYLEGILGDILFCDPPYGIDEKTDRVKASRGGAADANTFKKIAGDKNTDVAKAAVKFLLPLQHGGKLGVPVQVWFGANHYSHALPESPTWLVWDKRVEEKEKDFNSDCELAYIIHKTKSVRIFRHKWKGIIKDSEHGVARIHPTQKPIALIEHCIKEYAPEAKVLIDPFLGSGSSLIACEQLGIQCVGTELEPSYCQLIIDRYEKFCLDNKKPVTIKINGKVLSSG